ncbi:MAG TPA: hypothetical protein VND19_01815 [Acetobacteraceae bacterium]|nr:hypothetical protein [Acetobacteraceae bacterium]
MSGTSTLHCAVCGGPARAPFHAPRQPETAPDLDMRPGEPVRSTLRDWVQACGTCGAAAPDLSILPPAMKSVVESPAYRALSMEAAEDTLLFRRWAMICLASGDKETAAEATLQGAWAADDAADMTEAAKLRRDVAALWGDPEDRVTALRLLDVLRRAGEFAAVEARGQKLAAGGLDAFATAIVAFQRAHAAERDVGRHLRSSVAPDHALPTDLPTPKFWDRLLPD